MNYHLVIVFKCPIRSTTLGWTLCDSRGFSSQAIKFSDCVTRCKWISRVVVFDLTVHLSCSSPVFPEET